MKASYMLSTFYIDKNNKFEIHITHMSHVTYQMLGAHMSDNFERGPWERCWCWTGLEPAKKNK